MKNPYRPDNTVTQSFNDGIVTVCAVTDVAVPGYKPTKQLTEKKTLRYQERRLGIQRFFSGMQNQISVERVVRCPRQNEVNSQDIAITQDGRQYRIDLVQMVQDVFPPCMDLTLTVIEQKYEVIA